MTKKIRVEFWYFDRSTCSRCRATAANVEKTMRGLRKALGEESIGIELRITKLPSSKLAQSNSVLINGIDIEEIVNKKRILRSTSCRGCSTLLNGSCVCRAYTYHGKKYTYVPKGMIREAIRNVLAKK